nr:ribonuclease H-like domain-containing protein [Tanacetum cinerariifolium]
EWEEESPYDSLVLRKPSPPLSLSPLEALRDVLIVFVAQFLDINPRSGVSFSRIVCRPIAATMGCGVSVILGRDPVLGTIVYGSGRDLVLGTIVSGTNHLVLRINSSNFIKTFNPNTTNNVDEIEKFKEFLRTKFHIKDLGKLKYFLGIEVLETDLGLCLSQREYCLDLLSEYGLFACKPFATHVEQNLAISNEPTEIDKVLDNITEYQRLIGKLIYLTHTRPDISYSVNCLSQFMHKPLRSHIKIAL